MTINFDLNKYSDNNVVMWCKTKDEANAFLRFLDTHGYRWCTNLRYIDDDMWHIHTSETCYRFNTGHFGSRSYYINEGCTVLELSDYIKNDVFYDEDNVGLNEFLGSFKTI